MGLNSENRGCYTTWLWNPMTNHANHMEVYPPPPPILTLVPLSCCGVLGHLFLITWITIPPDPVETPPTIKIKSSFSFYFFRRSYFYIRIYTIKQITRNQISSTCAHHWNNSQQCMCCRRIFLFRPDRPYFSTAF